MLPIPKKAAEGRASATWSALGRPDERHELRHVRPARLAREPPSAGRSALVRDGDLIELDVQARQIHLHVSDDELASRRRAWAPRPGPARGYTRMFLAHIGQASEGCDFDYLMGTEPSPEPEIH